MVVLNRYLTVLSTFITFSKKKKIYHEVLNFYLPCVDISVDKICHTLHLLMMFLKFFVPKSGGHENFSKMIDEAEVLEFPMVVKNTRGHRGVYVVAMVT